MRSHFVGAAGVASCCIMAGIAIADAAELRLSDRQLDGVTAGVERLFDSPTGLSTYQLDGPLTPPPPVITPPTNPPDPPTPPAPVPNQITLSEGGVTIVIGIPSGPPGSTAEIGGNIGNGSAFAFTTVTSEGGTVVAPGVSTTVVSTGN